MEWTNAVIGFFSGIVLAVFTAIVKNRFENRTARQKRIEDARFQIYMKLLDLYNLYFWVVSREFHQEEVRPELKDQIRMVSGQIADQLRSADDVESMPEILRILMSTEFPSARARHRAMEELLDRLGATVNPKYAQAIRQISNNNVSRLAEGSRMSNTTPILIG